MGSVRVRFAPSPTGRLHVGGARTALFNWLFARRHGGAFVLRIEDTDTERSGDEYLSSIQEALSWLGLDWDEGPGRPGPYGPYLQSQRIELYRRVAEELLEKGYAYRCYCTQQELAELRKQAFAQGKAFRYPGICRHLSPAEAARREAEGRAPVIRIIVPEEGQTVVNDLIRGQVVFDNSSLDDFIIMKSNGMPAYNFACVVDDHYMAITHVIRAEEHLSNTPRQLWIYRACGFPEPAFAHVPMILAPDRSKLSKRHGATSVEEFREEGYLPEALVNYLCLLGWTPGDNREIMPLKDILAEFSLDRVARTAAIYDVKKLTWMNGHYLREAELDRIVDLSLPFLRARGYVAECVSDEQMRYVRRVVEAVRDRVKTLAEVADASSYFFTSDFEYEEKGVKKHFLRQGVATLLRAAVSTLSQLDTFDKETIERAYRSLADDLGVAAGELIHPTRLAVSGRTMGPGLFDILEILGREETLKRMERAIAFIEREN